MSSARTTADRDDSPARCLIPCAGLGARMRPVTSTIPKELLPIGTRPILQWCLTEALEGGFDEIGIVTREDKPSISEYVESGRWREGLLKSVTERAERVTVELFGQDLPLGVVDAVLSAGSWIEDGVPFAVYLPDNVRIAGGVTLTESHARESSVTSLVVAHRVGPEARHFFANVGRAELDSLVPAGARPRVEWLQERDDGTFEATPEGAWRLAPRYTVGKAWIEAAREVLSQAGVTGVEADDVDVHRLLVEDGALHAIPWRGTLVDAGSPTGYLYAQHLLHEAGATARDAVDQGSENDELIQMER